MLIGREIDYSSVVSSLNNLKGNPVHIYTNIPLTYTVQLNEIKRLLMLRNVTWKNFLPDVYYMEKKFSYMRSLADFLTLEKIPFVTVGVSYDFEGHVDRSDLFSGDFTWTENLLLIGYTKKYGLFKTSYTTRTGVPSNEGGYSHFPAGEKLVTFLDNFKNMKSIE